MKEKIALFPGSFDPITKGHESVVLRALSMFDKIVIAIGSNNAKNSVFPLEKRIEWIRQTFAGYDNIEISTFNSLTIDYCKQIGAKYILRGLRNSVDFQYERNIARINQELDSEIVFACDNGDINIDIDYEKEMKLIKKMKTTKEKKEYVENL